MNFILLTDYYYPIVKSGAIIVEDLAIELLRQGHNVTIVTFVDDQTNGYQDIVENNIRIIRIRVSSRKYGRIGRFWAENTYSFRIIRTLRHLKNVTYDSIICYSPSIFYGKSIRWLKNNDNIKAYLIIRDIFPKWAVDAGIIKRGMLYKYFKYIECDLYNSVDYIGIEASSDFDYFREYVKSEKIEVLDNWGASLGQIDKSLGSHILDDNKVNIVYGGNMGDAQDILSLIELIDDSILDGHAILTLIGDGGQVSNIKKALRDNNINNVILLPSVDRDTYLSIISKADVGLVSLNKRLSSNNYPLKMIGYMQLSLPILASVNKDNEIIDLISQKNIGLVSQAGDAEAFNRNLSNIIHDKKLRLSQGRNSLELFNERFDVEAAVLKIYNQLHLAK